MLLPTVFNTSEICAAYGVHHAIISPGSRNAPLTISFARNRKLKKWIIPDERSAGFIALGIAQKLKEPVVLCCTSGTALLNYAPAIAEAYYREIPLIVLSADRPPELIDQRDGQTIRQFEVLQNHVKASIQLPVIFTNEDKLVFQDLLTSSMETAQQLPKGPVHLNVPFREPFYPTSEQKLSFSPIPKWNLLSTQPNAKLPNANDVMGKRILILIGQSNTDEDLNASISRLQTLIPILAPCLSNVKAEGIEHIDLFLNNQTELAPEVLITSGLSVLSKKLKEFLRKNKPAQHFHFDPGCVEVDTFKTSPKMIKSPLHLFLDQLDTTSISNDYYLKWKQFSDLAKNEIDSYMSRADFSETTAFYEVLKTLPENIDLHLANSMPVRFAELFGLGPSIEAWSNRGTSGIDGCTSTAVGTCLVSIKMNVLLTGDLGFLYDRNAFFHNYTCKNLRVVIFNNQGGGIFRLIDGPTQLPELEEYFETRHNRTAEYICQENHIQYSQVRNIEQLNHGLRDFFDDTDNPKLMEIFTDPETNERIFNALKQHVHEQINN